MGNQEEEVREVGGEEMRGGEEGLAVYYLRWFKLCTSSQKKSFSQWNL